MGRYINTNLKFITMDKKEIKGKDQIKIDNEIPENEGGEHKGTGIKRVVKDSHKMIVAFVFLAVLALMGILQAHYGAILAVTVVEAILIYSIHKEGYDNIQK